MPNADIEEKRRAAREVIDVLEEISLLLVREKICCSKPAGAHVDC